MRTENKEFKIFTYEELSDEAKEKARQIIGESNTDNSWWYECITEEFDADGYFEVDKVYFSGFWSQGDGAIFEYSRITDKLVNEAIESLWLPKWKKDVLKGLGFVGSGKHRGHYYHSGCCAHYIEQDTQQIYRYPNIEKFYDTYLSEIEDYVISKYDELCGELYRSLEKEYCYQFSEECVVENIACNGYEFNENGTIYK
jgi:hypothetical protein